MIQPSREDAYRSAMNAAMDELGLINEEAALMRNRMHQIDALLEALKLFMRSTSEQTTVEDRGPMYKSTESAAEAARANGLTPQTMVGTAIPEVVPRELIESPDPIQRRINSVLGLAVA